MHTVHGSGAFVCVSTCSVGMQACANDSGVFYVGRCSISVVVGTGYEQKQSEYMHILMFA